MPRVGFPRKSNSGRELNALNFGILIYMAWPDAKILMRSKTVAMWSMIGLILLPQELTQSPGRSVLKLFINSRANIMGPVPPLPWFSIRPILCTWSLFSRCRRFTLHTLSKSLTLPLWKQSSVWKVCFFSATCTSSPWPQIFVTRTYVSTNPRHHLERQTAEKIQVQSPKQNRYHIYSVPYTWKTHGKDNW